jgi:WD40 repeat protein
VEKDRTGKVHELGRHNETKLMAWRAPGELWIADDSKDKRLLSWKLSESKPREIWNNRIRHALGGVSNFTCMKVGSRYALLGLRDGAVAVLDVATEKFERYVNLSPGAIRCVALSSDESWALAGDEQGQLHRFTLPEGRADPPLAAHHDSVDQVAVQRDSLIISASADLHVRFARIDGETLFSLKLPRPVKLMRLTPEGKNLLLLLREERALRVWHLDRLEQAFEQLGAGVRLVP